MKHQEVIRRITATGIVPVVRAPSSDDALKVVDAVRAGGIDVVEITMTVPGAVELVHELTRRCGEEVVVGAGTVLDAETARACILAGAAFVVSPILDEATITCCRRYGVPVMPGALTPTEVLTAWEAGADIVKIFPCGNVGGAKYIKALKAPYPHIELIPTGGVNLETVGDFLKAGACAVAVGAELVDAKSIKEGRLEVIAERARLYLAAIAKARAEIAAAAA